MNQKLEHHTLTRQTLDEIEAQLQHCLNGRVHEFRLSLHDGGLIIEGFTHSYYAKQLAQHAVMDTVALPIRANLIEVV